MWNAAAGDNTHTHTHNVWHTDGGSGRWRRRRNQQAPAFPSLSISLLFCFPLPALILEQPSPIYTRCPILFSSLQIILVSQEKKTRNKEKENRGESRTFNLIFRFVSFRFVCCCWDRNTRKGLEMLQFMVWWFVSRIDEWTGHQWATLDYSSSL